MKLFNYIGFNVCYFIVGKFVMVRDYRGNRLLINVIVIFCRGLLIN